MSEYGIKRYLAENPKKTGVLFTLLLLLTQTGSAAAAVGCTIGGP
ncbi:hypothetical protein ACFQPA_14615 [Halomarina halobia]|uniref:Uncharacterized protein n=1 Tax=Halomarina halobia TaxID=3033386 RepID=A0ABD6A932_9EURY|nr:hypothetical protein [Halomarina sp. PSR21]